MLDDLTAFNRERWEALARAGVQFSVPWLDLDAATARGRVDPEGLLDEVAGAEVLCLAAGGGQQSAAFALLGAQVTVLDFSSVQLQRDRETAAHYGVAVRALEGDMRDLSRFADGAFDLVWQAHAIAFIPDPERVFDEVTRVLRPGGLYRLSWTNPFVHGIWDAPWTEAGYPLKQRYVDGAEVTYDDPEWNVRRSDGTVERVHGPREWRHGLGSVVNGLIARGLEIRGIWESIGAAVNPEPGTWAHCETIAPPWLTLWARRSALPAPGRDRDDTPLATDTGG